MIELPTATIHGIKTLGDKTLRVTLDLREMNQIDMAILMASYMQGEEGFKLPEIIEEDSGKSPAQRLRSALYVYWDKNTSKNDDFETFYRRQMEKFIATIKDRID